LKILTYSWIDGIFATTRCENSEFLVFLDRFMDSIHLVKITGRSYRVKSLNKKLENKIKND